LEESRVGVVVEVDSLLEVVIGALGHVIEQTFRDLGLTATSVADKEGGYVDLDELAHQELSRDGVRCWNCEVLDWLSGVEGVGDVLGLKFDPLLKLVLLKVYVVIEDSTLGWELNNLPFVFPPVGE
jgi:hypothetical protein